MNVVERWKSIIQEENEEVSERLELAQQRIAQIPEETTVKEKYQPYFNQCATLVQKVLDVVSRVGNCELRNQSEAWLRQQNIDLYEEIMPKAYETSYANPVYCYKLFGEEGKSLSFLYAQLRSLIPFAFEYRLVPITVTLELLLEIYNIYEEQEDDVIKSVKSAIYYFAHDYCEDFLVARMRETNDPTYSFAYDIIMDSNLNDLSYLYYYGEYIDENERKIAAFLNAMPEEEVKKLADTFTEGYIRGFQVMGADLSKKSIVGIRTCIGFERMMRYAIQNFEKIGKKVVIYRIAYDVITKKYGRKVGYYATSPNQQYEYDHRFDKGLFFDKNMKECMLAGLKNAYEKYKLEVAEYAGPAVLETFGEPDFEPVKHSETISLDERQQQWSTQYSNEASMLSYEYSKAEETSFTIIAFPLPSIGESFEAIFAETVKVNTLDNQTYKEIQQCLIDALDQGKK